MMKKILKLFFVILFIFLTGRLFLHISYGQTSSPSAAVSATTSPDKDIQNLKDKIATKVAELRHENNLAVAGFVTDVTDTSLKIKTLNDKSYDIKLDDTLTKYYQIVGAQKKEIKQSDIKKGSYVIVTGVITDSSVAANSVYIDEAFLVKSGKISQVDKENFSLKVATQDKDIYTLNIETFTKQTMLNIKTLDIERVGFSKIKEGDTVHFVVKKTGKEKDNIYSAQKILIIPQEYFIK